MVRNNLDLQQAIGLIDNKISPKHLNRVQEIILIKSLEGQTYSQIAIDHNYGMEYIKTSGSELWKLLSQAFEQPVNKSNCNSFIRRQIAAFTANTFSLNRKTETIKNKEESFSSSHVKEIAEADSISPIAPKTFNFQGRESELACIKRWSDDPDCRFIMMKGMVGCGKTTLAIEAAKILKNKFRRVIYLSMSNSLNLKDSLKFCLHSLDPNFETSSDVNKLLVDLTLYLKKHRCLILLDDLDSVVEFKQMVSYYRSGCEQYAQFLRCLITTNHQSLVIAASRNNIKQLDYYSSNRVKSIYLKGMNPEALWSIYKSDISVDVPQEIWKKICNYYQYNPELIKIVVSNLGYLPISDFSIYENYILYIEEIDMIIEQQLELLDQISKEIVYWLAFGGDNSSLDKLFHKTSYQPNKILRAVDFLKEHYLIVENNRGYALLPMYKDYIQRYLIDTAKKSLA